MDRNTIETLIEMLDTDTFTVTVLNIATKKKETFQFATEDFEKEWNENALIDGLVFMLLNVEVIGVNYNHEYCDINASVSSVYYDTVRDLYNLLAD